MEKRTFIRDAVDDLVLLDKTSESAILATLENRFKQDLIYTYIGPVLLSVNPYKQIRGLYSKDLIQKYERRYQYELAPHVFAVAEDAFRNLLKTGVNQCVLVSGESGAGKTETAKKLMEYITEVSGDVHAKHDVKDIKDALLSSNPVLEAFGNATTLVNDNSSRFGKFLEIEMDYDGVPVGGRVSNYLLEKPRVVNAAKGERSFHVFYQLCAGGRREYGVGPAESYKYLSRTGNFATKGISDANDYKQVVSAMETVGINSARRKELFSMVAAVLWLGNIDFEQKGNKAVVARSSKDALKHAAQMLKVSAKTLEASLTNRTIETRGDKVTSPLPAKDAPKSRDALAKALYARAFQHLVLWINERIKTDDAELTIGVLDIYGFEIFETNSFEQLMINYCNERLQQLFIELTLRSEQDEYAAEGIQWEHIDYFNNKIVCDLIEAKRPAGIIAYLDEESIYPNGSDASLLQKMNRNLSKHPHYMNLVTSTNKDVSEFGVKHYAGTVLYSTTGMLEKNKDLLFRDLITLAGSSKSSFIQDLFPESKAKHDMKRPVTAGWQFVLNMQKLVDNLQACEPHYIRTLKPNNNKRPGQIDEKLMKHQSKYLGLKENVVVRKAGFSFRREYDKFVTRYKMICPQTWPKESNDPVRDTRLILAMVQLGQNDYQEGKSKVFIRKAESLFALEEMRDARLNDIARVLQGAYRSFEARKYFMELREKSVKLMQGKKRRRGSWALYFQADYIEAKSDEFIVSTFRSMGDKQVLFADTIEVVMGKKNKASKRVLLVTERGLYILDMQKRKVDLHLDLAQIDSLCLSTFADGFIALKSVDDRLSDVLFKSVRKCEIVTVLSEEWARVSGGRLLNCRFQDTFNLEEFKKGGMFSKSKVVERVVSFTEDHSLTFGATIDELPVKDGSINIRVSPKLGSRAPIQLNTPIPDRIYQYSGKNRKPVAAMGKSKRPYGGFTPSAIPASHGKGKGKR